MQPFTIKYYRPGAGVPPAAFFILSRGRNAGRPSFSANRNCYLFTCAEQDLSYYYWLVYGLWDARHFTHLLHGTCVQLMFIDDLRNLIADTARRATGLVDTVDKLQKLLSLENKMKKQLSLIAAARQLMLTDRLIRVPA